MPITIREVAKRLNLSITTVSRALDGYDDVAQETQQKVIRTARKMGYTPNRAARQLRRQKADTIGFILPASAQRISEPFFMEFIAGMGDELTLQGYDLLVANATTEENEKDLYQRWVGSNKVDGLIVNRIYAKDWRVQFLSERKIHFAALERSNDPAHYPSIQVDGEQCYFDLLTHLVENRFLKIAFIGGPTQLVNHKNRLAWIKKAAKKLDLEIESGLVVSSDLTSMGGYQAAKELLQSATPPDAILCIDDETAFGVLHAAHEMGLSIGSQIAIAGFDGTLESRHTEPPLTTLDIPLYDIARDLVRMVLKSLAGDTSKENSIKIIPELQVRGSTHQLV
ncbi:MAG: LacI family DNA-binding transcriptional regulator [Anaerolineaceae bacterium]